LIYITISGLIEDIFNGHQGTLPRISKQCMIIKRKPSPYVIWTEMCQWNLLRMC